jgi:hypothetical protein
MYRHIRPKARQKFRLRIGVPRVFHRASEVNGFRGCVAALLDDPGYEEVDVTSRVDHRLRLAEEFKLLAELANRKLSIGDGAGPGGVDIRSDEHLVRALHRARMVSRSPSHAQQ